MRCTAAFLVGTFSFRAHETAVAAPFGGGFPLLGPRSLTMPLLHLVHMVSCWGGLAAFLAAEDGWQPTLSAMQAVESCRTAWCCKSSANVQTYRQLHQPAHHPLRRFTTFNYIPTIQ